MKAPANRMVEVRPHTIRGYLLPVTLSIVGALIGLEAATGHGAKHNPSRSAFMARLLSVAMI